MCDSILLGRRRGDLRMGEYGRYIENIQLS
jgi:hypothetical protein